jgi:uncharacterized protein
MNTKPIPPDIEAEIQKRMNHAESEHGVKILLAVESGSRAWGFASANSDYDARFIYMHPKAHYLSIDYEEQRDVIEYPIVDEIDLNGWDIRKASRLFWRSNPTFVEWIQSPIVYRDQAGFATRCRALLPDMYAQDAGLQHYRSMAKNTYKTHLQSEQVAIKKYFYALRPLLAVRWIERYASAPPIEFASLLNLLDEYP